MSNTSKTLTAAHDAAEAIYGASAELATGFTCNEAESIAFLIRSTLGDDAADQWLEHHAYGDDEPQDQHRADYLRLHGLPADHDEEK